MVEIYELHDPRDGIVRYVGQSRSAVKRLRWHLWAAQYGYRGRVYNWLRVLLNLGLKPTIAIVVRCEEIEADEAERAQIAARRAEGCDLTNCTDGGGGRRGWSPGPDTRAKIGAAHRGKNVSEETRVRISTSKKGWRPSAEHLARLRIAATGRTKTAEEREAISARMSGNKHALGCVRSEETRAKMGASAAGERSAKATISNDEADLIRDMHAVGIRQFIVARLLGLSNVTVNRVVKGRTFRTSRKV